MIHSFQKPCVKNILLETPLAADFRGGNFLFFEKPVDRDQMKSKVFGRFFRCHDLSSFGSFDRIRIFWLFHLESPLFFFLMLLLANVIF